MIPKPGPRKKKKPKMPNPPAEKYCRRCGRDDGTCAWRHAEARIIKFQFGGGITGGRIPHDQTAWLCMDCDLELSQPLPKDATQAEFEEHARNWRELINKSHGGK